MAARDDGVECDINWWPLLIVVHLPLEAALLAAGAGIGKAAVVLRRRPQAVARSA